MARHEQLREKVFVPVRPLEEYVEAFRAAGFTVLHVFEETIFARIDEWYRLLSTYHDGVLSWIGGSEKVEGMPPTEEAIRQRLFLIRYSLEKLFPARTHSRAPGPISPAAADRAVSCRQGPPAI